MGNSLVVHYNVLIIERYEWLYRIYTVDVCSMHFFSARGRPGNQCLIPKEEDYGYKKPGLITSVNVKFTLSPTIWFNCLLLRIYLVPSLFRGPRKLPSFALWMHKLEKHPQYQLQETRKSRDKYGFTLFRYCETVVCLIPLS